MIELTRFCENADLVLDGVYFKVFTVQAWFMTEPVWYLTDRADQVLTEMTWFLTEPP